MTNTTWSTIDHSWKEKIDTLYAQAGAAYQHPGMPELLQCVAILAEQLERLQVAHDETVRLARGHPGAAGQKGGDT